MQQLPDLQIGEQKYDKLRLQPALQNRKLLFNQSVNLLPTSEVEVANTKISPIREFQRLSQCRQQWQVDVVKDAWHSTSHRTNVKTKAIASLIEYSPQRTKN